MSITGASESIDTDEEGNATERASPAAPNYDNPEQRDAIRGALRDKREAKREELSKAERDKRAIFDALERETCRVRIGPKPIEFSILWGDEEKYIEDTVGEFMGDDRDEEDLSADEYRRYQDLNERIVEILADHAVDDAYDEAFFERIPQVKRESAIMDLRQGGIEAERGGN